MFSRRPAPPAIDELPPAPPPLGAVQRIPEADFRGPAHMLRTKRSVDMLVRSKGYKDYDTHRQRFENTTYLSAFGLLGLFGFAYADFIAMIALGKTPSAGAIGSLLVVSPYWLAITLSWAAVLIVCPCAFMTPWSSLFFELDDWSDVKGVVVFQVIAITLSTLIPYYHFGAIHQPAHDLESFCWTFAATAVPTIVGVIYYLWRSQHWQRAVAFTTIPLWSIPVIFGLTTFTLWDLVHNGRNSVLLSPNMLWSRVVSPSVTDLKHMWGFFQLHSWTALVFSYMWYLLPKFV